MQIACHSALERVKGRTEICLEQLSDELKDILQDQNGIGVAGPTGITIGHQEAEVDAAAAGLASAGYDPFHHDKSSYRAPLEVINSNATVDTINGEGK